MAVTARDDTLAHSFMFLCIGTAVLLLLTRCFAGTAYSQVRSSSTKPARSSDAKVLPPALGEDSRIVVDLSDRRVYLYKGQHKGQQPVASYPVAVGQAGWETPTGTFRIQQMQQNPKWQHPITGEVIPAGAKNPLGDRWIGFWSNENTQIGFHGTNQENLIGQAVSHGCLRMKNRDIAALYAQVSVGMLVYVRL